MKCLTKASLRSRELRPIYFKLTHPDTTVGIFDMRGKWKTRMMCIDKRKLSSEPVSGNSNTLKYFT